MATADSPPSKSARPKTKQIDSVPAKLKESALMKHEHYKSIILNLIEYVLPHWSKTWRYSKPFASILNKGSIFDEIEESVPVIHFALNMISNIAENAKPGKDKLSIPIIDLCSGKGILSMLLVSFIKLVPAYKESAAFIQHIYLIDRSWDIPFIEVEEMKAKNEDPTKMSKCPIKSAHLSLLSDEFGITFSAIRTNIHNKKIIQVINERFDDNAKIVLLAIHLCRRLSVRAIELYNCTKNVYGFLLAPCCLPIKNGHTVRVGPLWQKTYHLWSQQNKQTIDVNQAYLVKGIMPYMADIEDEKQMKENEVACCYQLALMSGKQMNARNKKLMQKHKLSVGDIEKLNRCKDVKTEIEIIDTQNELFIAAELLPQDLFALGEEYRYNQWISFLFNGIDAGVEDEEKRIYRVPLTGNEHRCDAYLTAQRNK